MYFIFFFFKQKTAYEIKECDWSSDVCSSDLVAARADPFAAALAHGQHVFRLPVLGLRRPGMVVQDRKSVV